MLEATTRNILYVVYNRKYWCLFFLFLAINFVIHLSLIEPGLILANDFTRAEDFGKFVTTHLYPMWDEHAQRSNLSTHFQLNLFAPAVIISSLISIPANMVFFVYLILFGSLSGVFTFKLTEYVMVRTKLKPRFEFAIISSLFFIFASFVVETTFHPGIAFSFYLSPVLFYLLIRGIEEDRISYLLLSSVIYALVVHTLHFVIFGLIIILSYIVYDLLYRILIQRFHGFSSLKRAAWYTLIIIGPFIALNSYWLIPNFAFSGLELYSNPLVKESSELLYRNVDIINIFSVKGDFALYSYYPYSESELTYMNILSITLTVIALSSLVLCKPNKLLIYLAIFLVLAVVISLVPHYFPDLYNWLIFEIPGSSLYSWVFRTPKFLHFMSIPIAVMLSLSSFRIYQILLLNRQKRRFSKAIAPIFLTIVLVFSLVPNYILLTGNFNGLHRTYELPGYYTEMLSFLQKQEEGDVKNYKSIWGPRYAGLNSSWSSNSIGRLEEQISPTNTFSSLQTLNHYIYPVIFGIRFPLGTSMVYNERTSILNEFLGPMNVKYIIVHNDISLIKNRVDKLSTVLNNQKGLLESKEFGPITLYTIKEPAEQFSIKQNTILIQGGGLLRFDSVFRTEGVIANSSMSNNNNKNNSEAAALSNTIGVFFSDTSLEKNPEMWNLSGALIPEKQLSYAEYMLDKNDVIVIPTSDYTNNYAPLELWSQTSINRPSFGYELYIRGIGPPYQFDYGKNIVFTSGNNSKLEIPISLSEAGGGEEGEEYKVLLRYFANEKGGLLNFDLGGKSVELDTKSNVNKFVWADLGTVASSSEQANPILSIENRNGFNALNLIALVPAEKYDQYKAEFINSLQNKDIIHIFEAESDFNFFDGTAALPVVDDIDYSNGKALELDSALDIASTEFEILKNGKYDLAVYGEGTITAYIDGVTSRTINLTQGIPHIESLELNSGNHFIQITQGANSTSFPYLDSIFIRSIKTQENGGGQSSLIQQQAGEEAIITYQKIDPTTYEVNVKAESSSPFMLAFAEAYDERWTAEVEEISSSTDTNKKKKKIFKPLPLYGTINGFFIDTEGLRGGGGEYLIHINYAPQEIFHIGAGISAVSLALVTVYLIRVHHPIFPVGRNNSG